MKAFILGIVLIAAVSVGAYYTLENMGFSQANVTVSNPNVRLGDEGSGR